MPGSYQRFQACISTKQRIEQLFLKLGGTVVQNCLPTTNLVFGSSIRSARVSGLAVNRD